MSRRTNQGQIPRLQLRLSWEVTPRGASVRLHFTLFRCPRNLPDKRCAMKIAGIVLLIPFLLLNVPCTSAQIPLDGRGGGVIAYQYEEAGTTLLHLMNADGSGDVAITESTNTSLCPAWSPDGSRLLFISNMNGDFDVYVMEVLDLENAEFGPPQQLTNLPGFESLPRWSEDGDRIIWSSSGASGSGIYILTLEDGEVSFFNTGLENSFQPDWSPDDSQIVFSVAGTSQRRELYIINTDSTGLIQIGNGYTPEWSPVSNRIVVTDTPDGDEDLFTMNPDGSDVVRLTTNDNHDFTPTWSPDGTRIAYQYSSNGPNQIHIVNADGTNDMAITSGPAPKTQPSWMMPQQSGASEYERADLPGFELHTPWPNPFNNTATIQFELADPALVRLEVFNVRGRMVRTLVAERLAAGTHIVSLHSAGRTEHQLASGVYLCRMTVGSRQTTQRMVLAR
jgi:WD40-like Beta Propeller Repeat